MICRYLWLVAALALALPSCRQEAPPSTRGTAAAAAAAPGAPAASETAAKQVGATTRPVDSLRTVVDAVKVYSYDKLVYEGRVDLSATIDRIRRGERHSHRNDGSVFRNRERRLPKKPRGYYTEYVHPTEGMRGPGPQRIVTGRQGEWYYTPDHYKSFIPLHAERARPPPESPGGRK